MAAPRVSLGVDYGTNSVRALLVDVDTGEEVATSVFGYPSGDSGVLLDERDPNLARQSPADILLGFREAVREAVREAGIAPEQLVGIGVDTTGSSPMPTLGDGTPLGLVPTFQENPSAQIWLWKDHTSIAEAAEITEKAAAQGRPYLAKIGGTYSSEWYWAKALKCLRVAPDVFARTEAWVELSDMVPQQITGTPLQEFRRNVCAAGHKAMYAPDWGGLPDPEFLESLDPSLNRLARYGEAFPADQIAGRLSHAYATATGLAAGTPVAVGIMDAHAGAVGSGVRPGTLVKILGTSGCDIAVHTKGAALPDIPGVCGVVDGSVIPGMVGVEAGQSAVGDLFNWFVGELCPPEYAGPDAHAKLSRAAEALRPGESGLVALDWNNGNRTVLVDPLLSGLLVGSSLHTSAPEVYRALIEATAFGALKIVERMEAYGVAVEQIVTGGGIAEKNALVRQIYADVLGRPIRLSRSAQTCALGAAIFGSVAGGAHSDTEAAQAAMAGLKDGVTEPIPENVATYRRLYRVYGDLHDAFGGVSGAPSVAETMKELLRIRDAARR